MPLFNMYIVYLYIYTLVVILIFFSFFFFNDTATTEIYTLSLHDALPIPRSWAWLATPTQPMVPAIGPRSGANTETGPGPRNSRDPTTRRSESRATRTEESPR